MKKRNPLVVFLLILLTAGIYGVFWFFATKEEMENEGVKIPSSWWFLVPVVNIWWLWKYSKGVETITKKSEKGESAVAIFILNLLISFLAIVVMQVAFNKIATKKDAYYSKISAFTKTATYVALVAIIALGQFWYITDFMDTNKLNERRFWSAIENSLSTQSVVKTTSSGASGQQDVNMQRIYLSGERLIHVDFLTEVNNPAQSFTLTINTEAQQYYDGNNYIRYTNYESSEGASLGEFIGQWAYQETDEQNLDNYQQQYASGLVSVVPFANLRPAQRAEVMEKLQDAYDVRVNDALSRDIDGEQIIQIPVVISLRPYLEALNDVLVSSGYPDLGLDPASAGEGILSASIELRARDSVITKVSYGSITESYSNYGVVTRPDEPETDVTYEQLQQAVQQRLATEENE